MILFSKKQETYENAPENLKNQMWQHYIPPSPSSEEQLYGKSDGPFFTNNNRAILPITYMQTHFWRQYQMDDLFKDDG